MERINRITFKRYLALLIIVILSVGGGTTKISAEDGESAPIIPSIVLSDNIGPVEATAGSEVTVIVPIKSLKISTSDPIISADLKGLPFTLRSSFDLIYSTKGDIKDTTSIDTTKTISSYTRTYLRFTLKVKDTAQEGDYSIPLNFLVKLTDDTTKKLTLDPTVVIRVVNEKAAPSLSVTDTSYSAKLKSGAQFDLKLTLANSGELPANKVKISVDGYSEDGIQPNYKTSSLSAGTVPGGTTANVTLPLMVSKNAKPGKKALMITMKYKDASGTLQTDTSTIYLDVIKSTTNTPLVVIENTSYPDKLKAGNEFNFVVSLKNKGAAKAKSVKIAVTNGYSTDGFIPNYTTETINAPTLSAGDKGSVKIPMIVSDTATAGVKTLSLAVTYTDAAGTDYVQKSNVYLEVTSEDGVSTDGKPNLVISNVTQTPASPNAGGIASVTFTIENKSKMDIKEMKIAATNLTNANFSPLDSEPYKYIEFLKAGKKKQITMQFSVSKTVAEGLNDLDVSIIYKDKKGKEYTDTAKIYVIDVVNDLGGTQSKPKLIISDFSTGKKDLVAGKTFKFRFSINNTHSTLSANNIKVTISSADNVFSIINGSNTFYIPSIGAGDTIDKEVQLKIKSDSVTKAYPIEVKFEYEYEGLEKVKSSNGVNDSVVATETLNIPVNENARPVVNNIAIGAYEAPTLNMPTTLSFEFYNMGRSTLNNVMARVEGDFTASSNMIYIGNVEAGSSDMQEIEVTPTVEGQSKGTLIISYEDSNGDTIEKKFPFEGTVQNAMPVDDGGAQDMPPVNVPTAKKPIVKTWLFILIQAGIVLGGVPFSRKVVLGLYKKKLRKQEEENS